MAAKKLAHEDDVDLRVWVNANGTAGDAGLPQSPAPRCGTASALAI
jgi:hypothetical protein